MASEMDRLYEELRAIRLHLAGLDSAARKYMDEQFWKGIKGPDGLLSRQQEECAQQASPWAAVHFPSPLEQLDTRARARGKLKAEWARKKGKRIDFGCELSAEDQAEAQLGLKLIDLARRSAVGAGEVDRRGILERTEESHARDDLNTDALALLRAWRGSRSPQELADKLNTTKMATISGCKASKRLVKHYTDILNSYELRRGVGPLTH